MGSVQLPRAMEPWERGCRDRSNETSPLRPAVRGGQRWGQLPSPQCRARPRCWPGQDEGCSLLCAVRRCLVAVTLVQLLIPLLGQNNPRYPGPGAYSGLFRAPSVKPGQRDVQQARVHGTPSLSAPAGLLLRAWPRTEHGQDRVEAGQTPRGIAPLPPAPLLSWRSRPWVTPQLVLVLKPQMCISR